MTQTTLLILFLVFEAAVVAGILVLGLHIVSVRKAIGQGFEKVGTEGWKWNAIPGAALNSMRDLLGSQPEQTKKIKEENIELARQVIHLQEDLEESVKGLERTKMELDESRRETIKAKQDPTEEAEAEALSEKDESEQLLEDEGQPEVSLGGTEGDGAEEDSFWDDAEQLASDEEVASEPSEPATAAEDAGEAAEEVSLWDEAEQLASDEQAASEPSEPATAAEDAGEAAEEVSLWDEAEQLASDEQAASEPSEPATAAEDAGEAAEEVSLWDEADQAADEESIRVQADQEESGREDGPDTPAGQAPAQPPPGSPVGEGLEGTDKKGHESNIPDDDFDYEVLEITLPEEGSNSP